MNIRPPLPAVFAAILALTACSEATPEPLGTSELGATDYVPLFALGTQVMEQIQYTEADGTLVTLAGFRPTNRHARERGEPWESPDVGPGNYFTFPTWYFQNRSFGLLIRDGVPAGRSRIEVSLRVNDGTFVETGISAFRRVDSNIRDYGWMMNIGFENPKEGGKNICHATSAREDCMAVITSNWRAPQPNTPFKVGDVIELTPAPYLLHTPDNKAVIDGGGIRYYSFEQLYQVGVGMRPWYGVAPTLDSVPLPASTLLGGEASVSYNYSEEPHRGFQQMVNNIGIANSKRFVEGRRLFHISFVDGKHSESPDINPVFTQHANQLGPRFNNVSCIGCHALNGRSAVPTLGGRLDTMAIETAASSSATQVTPDPTYGLNVQQRALNAGAPDYAVSVQSYVKTVRTLPDGETVELQKPVYAFKGPVPAQFSVRQAPQVMGVGLLEAVDEATLLNLADPNDQNGDGVRGVPNWATNPETGSRHLGRFGWKASKASLRQQSGDALLKDMGVTSPVYKSLNCQRGVANCNASGTATSISETEIERVASYLALLGVPAQRSLRSGFLEGIRVSPEHDVNPTQINRGSTLFAQAQCVACHTPQMKTGTTHPFAELRNQTIHPYTNLMLHDMGSGLADTLTQGQAGPSLWRTAPLWGIGSLKYVQGGAQNVRYLHDGRARTLMEAIAWHGGEANNSRIRFEALSKADRTAVLAFLESL
ncbi:di-heme oxidoredictase family protein [Stigmatella sp. ncwal1]|uniref:Di-heme oxidoredictase family protein n=1 Tax=Stigmatella ashevillensis TaxID=2995309 RepID=A0ABT5DLC9_9BACT|nr:di-heme oxidoredictase family protein [Stigmatella ashevillena]MDC0714413.1 di-heme oxidoredictase family protein [Stigmatella ashevillena]